MAELMSSGMELMFAGMGIVFLFLAMLVVVINVMSGLIQRYLPEDSNIANNITTVPNVASDNRHIAAITAAVHQYRSKH